jgi:hypothetical protein
LTRSAARKRDDMKNQELGCSDPSLQSRKCPRPRVIEPAGESVWVDENLLV